VRLLLVEPNQVEIDDLPQEAARIAVDDADRNQLTLGPGWVAGEGAAPLRLRERGGEIVRRQQGDRALRLPRGLVHLDDEVRARHKVPGLEQGFVPRLLKLPGDPLGPGAVGAVVRDEEVALHEDIVAVRRVGRS